MIMNWRPSTDRRFSRLGVVVSKRVGGAVVRARARRVLREAFRQLQQQITVPTDIVLVARKMIAQAPQSDVTRDLTRLLGKAKVLASPS